MSGSENIVSPEVIVATAPPKKVENRSVPIAVDPSTQQIVARDQLELVRLIRTYMKGSAFPKTLDTEEKIIAAWQLAASLNVPAIRAIQNVAFIHGTLSIWGELPKGLANATGEMTDFRVTIIDEKQDEIKLSNKNLHAEPWGVVIHIKRRQGSLNEYTYTMLDAIRAGLDKKTGPWRDHRPIMLLRRAVAKAVKFEFPDALMGLKICEYDLDEAPDLREVNPRGSDLANEINKTYLVDEPNDISKKAVVSSDTQ